MPENDVGINSDGSTLFTDGHSITTNTTNTTPGRAVILEWKILYDVKLKYILFTCCVFHEFVSIYPVIVASVI